MAITEGTKKKPPTFHYLPKNRAKQLKKSWVEDRKIRSKWKAQKKREGLMKQTSEPIDDSTGREHEEANSDSESNTSLPSCPDKSSIPTPSHDKPSLRDLRKIAYIPHLPNRQNSSRSHPEGVPRQSHKDRSGNVTHRREKGQPNMKLRMNVLLEKIKRDLS